jgi:hypothetical protein
VPNADRLRVEVEAVNWQRLDVAGGVASRGRSEVRGSDNGEAGAEERLYLYPTTPVPV